MVCSNGSIRCYDTISLSQKLSLHRKALLPFSIHVLLWDMNVNGGVDERRTENVPTASEEEPGESVPEPPSNELEEEVGSMERESIGDVSFRFEDVVLPSSWV